MADYAEKGRDYVQKADKKLKGFSLFGSSSAKNEEAAELLERAATQFKLAQSCETGLTLTLPQRCFDFKRENAFNLQEVLQLRLVNNVHLQGSIVHGAEHHLAAWSK